MRLGAILYNDFELLDLYGPLEMFGSLGEQLEILTIAQQTGGVASFQGPETIAQHSFKDAPECEMLLLPGGLGTIPELENPAMLDYLQSAAPTAQQVMSVCSGSALLAKAGLLDGRRATSNKMYFELARSQSAKVQWVEAARWVDDDPYVTSSGVSAGIDMSLAVIAKLFGNERAETVARYTEYQWHRDPDDDPFVQYLNQVPTDTAGA